MKKFIALAGVAAISFGGAAIAQDTMAPTGATTPDAAQSDTATPTTDAAPAPSSDMPSTATEPMPNSTSSADSMTTQPQTEAPAASADATTPTTPADPAAAPAASADATTGTTPADPATAPTATAGAQPAPATPGTEPTATADASGMAGTKTASADATAKVQQGWATYDKGNKGSLTALEFGSWVMAANGQDMTAQVEKSKAGRQANLPAVKVLNATSSEFAKADTDKSKTISPEELAVYLS